MALLQLEVPVEIAVDIFLKDRHCQENGGKSRKSETSA